MRGSSGLALLCFDLGNQNRPMQSAEGREDTWTVGDE